MALIRTAGKIISEINKSQLQLTTSRCLSEDRASSLTPLVRHPDHDVTPLRRYSTKDRPRSKSWIPGYFSSSETHPTNEPHKVGPKVDSPSWIEYFIGKVTGAERSRQASSEPPTIRCVEQEKLDKERAAAAKEAIRVAEKCMTYPGKTVIVERQPRPPPQPKPPNSTQQVTKDPQYRMPCAPCTPSSSKCTGLMDFSRKLPYSEMRPANPSKKSGCQPRELPSPIKIGCRLKSRLSSEILCHSRKSRKNSMDESKKSLHTDFNYIGLPRSERERSGKPSSPAMLTGGHHRSFSNRSQSLPNLNRKNEAKTQAVVKENAAKASPISKDKSSVFSLYNTGTAIKNYFKLSQQSDGAPKIGSEAVSKAAQSRQNMIQVYNTISKERMGVEKAGYMSLKESKRSKKGETNMAPKPFKNEPVSRNVVDEKFTKLKNQTKNKIDLIKKSKDRDEGTKLLQIQSLKTSILTARPKSAPSLGSASAKERVGLAHLLGYQSDNMNDNKMRNICKKAAQAENKTEKSASQPTATKVQTKNVPIPDKMPFKIVNYNSEVTTNNAEPLQAVTEKRHVVQSKEVFHRQFSQVNKADANTGKELTKSTAAGLTESSKAKRDQSALPASFVEVPPLKPIDSIRKNHFKRLKDIMAAERNVGPLRAVENADTQKPTETQASPSMYASPLTSSFENPKVRDSDTVQFQTMNITPKENKRATTFQPKIQAKSIEKQDKVSVKPVQAEPQTRKETKLFLESIKPEINESQKRMISQIQKKIQTMHLNHINTQVESQDGKVVLVDGKHLVQHGRNLARHFSSRAEDGPDSSPIGSPDSPVKDCCDALEATRVRSAEFLPRVSSTSKRNSGSAPLKRCYSDSAFRRLELVSKTKAYRSFDGKGMRSYSKSPEDDLQPQASQKDAKHRVSKKIPPFPSFSDYIFSQRNRSPTTRVATPRKATSKVAMPESPMDSEMINPDSLSKQKEMGAWYFNMKRKNKRNVIERHTVLENKTVAAGAENETLIFDVNKSPPKIKPVAWPLDPNFAKPFVTTESSASKTAKLMDAANAVRKHAQFVHKKPRGYFFPPKLPPMKAMELTVTRADSINQSNEEVKWQKMPQQPPVTAKAVKSEECKPLEITPSRKKERPIFREDLDDKIFDLPKMPVERKKCGPSFSVANKNTDPDEMLCIWNPFAKKEAPKKDNGKGKGGSKNESPSKKKEGPCKKKDEKKKEVPCKKKEDASKKNDDSCKIRKEPAKKKDDSSKKGDPCKKKDDPCKKKDDKSKKSDPCKKKDDPCKKKDDKSKKSDPCKKKDDPCKKKDDKSKKSDPCKKKDDPCKKKDDPCKKKDDKSKKSDPCKKKDDPCKKKDDPCKKKDDPCKKKDDPCKKKDDPCKKKDDKSKKSDPCKKKDDPCKKKDDPCKKKDDKSKKSDPCKKKDDPCKKKDDPCKKKDDPCKKKDDKSKKSDPCKKKDDPCKKKDDPCKKKDDKSKKSDPCKKKDDPCKKKDDPCKKKDDPCKKKDDPCKKKDDPCKKKDDKSKKSDPCKKKDDPCKKKDDPCKKKDDPCKKKDDPCKKKDDPCKKKDDKSKKSDPCKKKDDPCKKKDDKSKKSDPCKKKDDPCKKKDDKSKKSDPCKKKDDPCKKKDDPCKKKDDKSKKSDPCKKKDDPCKKKDDKSKKSDPCKKKDDPCKKKDDPCKKKDDPCKKKDDKSKKSDPCKKKDDPCKKKDDPCKKKDDPCKKKEDPCKKKDDPCKKKEDPCKKKDDPCKKKDDSSKKDDPCKKKDDPCKKKDDPCKKKDDPCKKKDDPCKKKDDPCKKKDDPCKKKDDPCKKKDDSSKKSDPCKKKDDPKYPLHNDPCKGGKNPFGSTDKKDDPCKKDDAKKDPCKKDDAKKDPCKKDDAKDSDCKKIITTKIEPSCDKKKSTGTAKKDDKKNPCKKDDKKDPCKKDDKKDPCKKDDKKDPCKKDDKKDPCKKEGGDECEFEKPPRKGPSCKEDSGKSTGGNSGDEGCGADGGCPIGSTSKKAPSCKACKGGKKAIDTEVPPIVLNAISDSDISHYNEIFTGPVQSPESPRNTFNSAGDFHQPFTGFGFRESEVFATSPSSELSQPYKDCSPADHEIFFPQDTSEPSATSKDMPLQEREQVLVPGASESKITTTFEDYMRDEQVLLSLKDMPLQEREQVLAPGASESKITTFEDYMRDEKELLFSSDARGDEINFTDAEDTELEDLDILRSPKAGEIPKTLKDCHPDDELDVIVVKTPKGNSGETTPRSFLGLNDLGTFLNNPPCPHSESQFTNTFHNLPRDEPEISFPQDTSEPSATSKDMPLQEREQVLASESKITTTFEDYMRDEQELLSSSDARGDEINFTDEQPKDQDILRSPNAGELPITFKDCHPDDKLDVNVVKTPRSNSGETSPRTFLGLNDLGTFCTPAKDPFYNPPGTHFNMDVENIELSPKNPEPVNLASKLELSSLVASAKPILGRRPDSVSSSQTLDAINNSTRSAALLNQNQTRDFSYKAELTTEEMRVIYEQNAIVKANMDTSLQSHLSNVLSTLTRLVTGGTKQARNKNSEGQGEARKAEVLTVGHGVGDVSGQVAVNARAQETNQYGDHVYLDNAASAVKNQSSDGEAMPIFAMPRLLPDHN